MEVCTDLTDTGCAEICAPPPKQLLNGQADSAKKTDMVMGKEHKTLGQRGHIGVGGTGNAGGNNATALMSRPGQLEMPQKDIRENT